MLQQLRVDKEGKLMDHIENTFDIIANLAKIYLYQLR